MAQHEVSFDCTVREQAIVKRIAKRAYDLRKKYADADTLKLLPKQIDTRMDLLATHANGCPMDFVKLEAADDFNLLHDVSGIDRHLNRGTGKLENCFLPRCAAKQTEAA